MKKIFFGFACLMAMSLLFISCGNSDIEGRWNGSEMRLNDITGVADASTVVSFDFSTDKASGDTKSGRVIVSALINANQPLTQDSTMIAPYEQSVAATASIEGVWAYEDDDDIVISYDPATFRINIDPEGVAMSENLLTGMQQPQVDSLTQITMNSWKNILGKPVRDQFNKFQKIEDVKVTKDILSFESGKDKLSFRKVQAQ